MLPKSTGLGQCPEADNWAVEMVVIMRSEDNGVLFLSLPQPVLCWYYIGSAWPPSGGLRYVKADGSTLVVE